MIPFMDLNAQYQSIKDEIDDAIFQVIRNYKFINGPDVKTFEQNFAEIQEIKYCVGTSSGTSALHLAYDLIGLSEGDEVIVPAMTFIATIEPLKSLGAKPVFVDINDQSFNIDEDKIEEKISSRTKAIVVVHLHGNPCEMDKIMVIADKYNLKVIEDCAQSHLSEYKNRKTGNFGDIATFSFYPGKNLGAYGDAGALLTNDSKYYEKAKLLVNHGREEKYVHSVEGYNYRLDTLQAAVLNVKLKYLEKWTDQRIDNAKYYRQKLEQYPVILPEMREDKKHVFHIFAIAAKTRDRIAAALKEHQIATGIHYPLPLHLQPAYKHLGYVEGDLPVAEKLAGEFLSLPMFSELSKDDINKICSVIEQVI
jgi:dTDP-4-amino-4,6-dideoxygalactose transaminase